MHIFILLHIYIYRVYTGWVGVYAHGSRAIVYIYEVTSCFRFYYAFMPFYERRKFCPFFIQRKTWQFFSFDIFALFKKKMHNLRASIIRTKVEFPLLFSMFLSFFLTQNMFDTISDMHHEKYLKSVTRMKTSRKLSDRFFGNL